MKHTSLLLNLKLVIGIALLGCPNQLASQDIHFSQFDETPLQLNPANAGTRFDARVIANYKSQWQSVNAPFKTFALSGDMRLLKDKKNHLGLGLDFFSDYAGKGLFKTNQVNVSLSSIININARSFLSAGLMAGYAQKGVGSSGYSWGNQYNGQSYDATMASGELNPATRFSYADLGAGLQYSYGSKEMYMTANNARQVTVGVSVFHPHQPAYSYSNNANKLDAKFILHGDAALGIKNTNLVLKPSYIIFIQGPTKEITPGMTFQYILQNASKYTANKKFSAFSFGGYYRVQDAFIALAKFEINGYALGFSYDINLSKLKTVSSARGGFEISLRAGINKGKGSTSGLL